MSLFSFDSSRTRTVTELEHRLEQISDEANTTWEQQHAIDGKHTDISVDSICARDSDDLISIDCGMRYTLGPWVLDADGIGTSGYGALRTSQLTANVNDYQPAWVDTAIMLELSSDAARTITGIYPGATARRRILGLCNVGAYTITLSHESASSVAANRMQFAGAANYSLRQYEVIWLYYVPDAARWRR